MVAQVATVAFLGLEARAVEVQVQIAAGLPKFLVVGLPDKAVGESRERVHAALAAIGLSLPPKRITVNLSPADLPKEGSHYDLPIALGLLAAMGAIDRETLAAYVAVGELSLDGRVAPSPGVLLAAIHASARGLGLICPAAQGSEAAWAGEIEVVGAPDLIALLNHLRGGAVLAPPRPGEAEPPAAGPDLSAGEGTGDRQARARDRRGRRPQSADDRAARRRQVAARRVPARHSAAADSGGGAGSVDDRHRRRAS